jgi:hypothetical protein
MSCGRKPRKGMDASSMGGLKVQAAVCLVTKEGLAQLVLALALLMSWKQYCGTGTVTC